MMFLLRAFGGCLCDMLRDVWRACELIVVADLLQANALAAEFPLYGGHVDGTQRDTVANRHGGGGTGTLPGDCTRHHVAHRGVASLVAGNAPPSHEEVVHTTLGYHAPERHLEVSPRRREDQNIVAVDELRKDANGVGKAGLRSHVGVGKVVLADNLPRVTYAHRHPKVSQLGLFKPRELSLQGVKRLGRPATASDLCLGQILHIGTVKAAHVHKIEVCCLASLAESRPRPGNGFGIGLSRCGCSSERQVQVGRLEPILLAGRLLAPLTRRPVLIRRGVLVDVA
mmetsp:Transcript_3169/g.7675  ORF Transcript_3169/g.7675 Transcript_3169/m.7675 type:complete len:284 (-) Transcript_3169:937-1788(-)